MMDPSLVTLAVLGLIGIVFIFLFVAPNRRAKDEAGLTLLYEERCSGRKSMGFGFFAGGNMLNWRISFYENFFIIASIVSTRIPYNEVELVEYKRHLVSKALHIAMRNHRMNIVLFPKAPQKMLSLFRSKGVSVVEQ